MSAPDHAPKDAPNDLPPAGGRRWMAALPLIAFVALAGLFASRLHSGGDPSVLPSALIGHAAPAFDLSGLPDSGRPGLSDADLRKGGVTSRQYLCVVVRTLPDRASRAEKARGKRRDEG